MEANIYKNKKSNLDYKMTRKDVEIFHKIETKKQVQNILLSDKK